MNSITLFILAVGFNCLAAQGSMFPTLPESPAKLIGVLKTAGERYTVGDIRVDYVKESDVAYLVGLLESAEPCASVDMAISSIRFPGTSTVGHEAAYLIEGFWKRYYPTELTSQRYKPDIQAMKRWYQTWSRLKKPAADTAR